MMLKVLVIQTANNLSDERTEFLINDRLSFMRFLGLRLSDRVPDARTHGRSRIQHKAADLPGPHRSRMNTTPEGAKGRGASREIAAG